MNNLPRQFEAYLVKTQKVSGKTLRNYRADLSHFSAWASLHLKTKGVTVNDLDQLVPHLSAQLIANYKGYHLENNMPGATVNRRLSTLRNLARFLVSSGILAEDPTKPISNIKRELCQGEKVVLIVDEFKKSLAKENISKITLKNYVSDIRHFLSWSLQKAGD